MRIGLSKLALALGVLAFTAGSASAQKVATDFDSAANFSQYKTYKWIKEAKTPNPLMAQRITEEVNAALQARGLRLVTGNETADLSVAAHAATKDEKTLNTFYSGFGGGWRWGGIGSATTMVDTYEVNTLVVDLFDSATKRAIWRGTATKTVSDNPEKNAKALTKSVDKMFKNFPPSARQS